MNRNSSREYLRKVFPFYKEEWSIDSEEDYGKIVFGPAYKDFTPRTLKGVKKDDKNVQDALKYLKDMLYKYIHNDTQKPLESQECFDKWHKDTCMKFVEKFNLVDEKDRGSIKYGKAQKIVNMSFKYLYLVDSQNKYADWFEFCHMPLDSYTLDWFIEKVIGDNNKISVSRIRETSWSNLGYGDKDKIYSYVWMQSLIREYLEKEEHPYIDSEGKKMTPFIAEFYIWPEQQWKNAFKSLDKLQIGKLEYPEYPDSDIYSLCEELHNLTGRMLKKFESEESN